KINLPTKAEWQTGKGVLEAKINSDGFSYPIKNFYMTDPISRASKTMAECVSVILENKKVAA
ncbi:MAG: hypothetical protein WCJ33_08375, partial [Pseudomonadota bacterium]